MKKKEKESHQEMTKPRLRRIRPVMYLLVMIIFISSYSFAQERKPVSDYNVSVTHATLVGKTRPVRELVQVPSTSKEKKDKYRRNKKVPDNFIGRGKSKVRIPELEHQGIDPLWQKGKSRKATRDAESIVNVDGLSNNFGSPHDPSGEIGHNYYVQAINATTIGVFEKDGSLLQSFAANSLWTELGASSLGDPIILYDQEVRRWVITEFANPAELLIGVSDTEDPLGSYNVYRFTTPNFPDYPKYGIWSNAYVVTTNEQGPSALHQYFIDREAMLNGEEDVTIQRIELGGASTEAGFYVTTPADWAGDTAPVADLPIVMRLNDSSWGNISEDAVEVYEFDIDFDNSNNTQIFNTTITTTPYDANPCAAEVAGTFACIPQLNGEGIDGIPEVIMNVPQYRNFGDYEAMVLNFITDVTDGDNLAGIRWMELRKSDGGDWELYQEGTYAPDDGLHRFMGSIAMDRDGNIGLSYNVSSPESYAGIRFTGRLASDELGEMTFNEVNIVDGINPINTFRFGDYAHMTVDPEDERTFWYTSEYAGDGDDNSLTRIHAFQLARDSTDIAPVALSSPESSSDLTDSETVTVEVRNFGVNSISEFTVGLMYEGAVLETFDFSGDLATDESYEHTFGATIDMSEEDEYEIITFTSLDGDENDGNDTLVSVINHYFNLDAAIQNLDLPEFTCAGSESAEFELYNNGTTTLESATIEVSVNDVVVETINWTGSLELGDEEEISIDLTDLASGTNTVIVEVSAPNGSTDEQDSNNSDSADIDFSDEFEEYTVSILTDTYPGETTWTVTDVISGDEIASGGPYSEESTLFETSFCVQPDGCLVFEIFDSAGDGLCCDYGEGGYEILDGNGEVLASGGVFGSSETQSFCSSDLAITEFISPVNDTDLSDAEEVTVSITNIGTTSISNFDITLEFEGSEVETSTYTEEIAPDATIEYTFTNTVDMSANGSYSLVASISSDDDLNENNNEISTFVDNLVATDVGISADIPSVSCSSPTSISVDIVNIGVDEITSLDIVINVDGTDVETIEWTGSLMQFESTAVETSIELESGTSTVTVTAENPNGGEDENTGNNEDSGSVEYDESLSTVTLEIIPDNYPGEITWEITSGESVIVSGGPYTSSDGALITEAICLDDTECYTLSFFDSFGDGICCAEGDGSYQLLDANGDPLIVSDGQYGSEESNEFCPATCNMVADIEVTHASSVGDGAILITATGGIEPYEYSIDGGTTFQSSNLFDGLAAGTYDVMVDDGTCDYQESVTINFVTNAGKSHDSVIEISPNPSNGIFKVNVTNEKIQEYSLVVQIVDMNGRLIQERRIGKYDDTFTGTISLYDYPDGVYFLRFVSPEIQTISRILKK